MIPQFKTKEHSVLKHERKQASEGYRKFVKVAEKYIDSDTCVGCNELCEYLGIRKTTLKYYARKMGIGLSILLDNDREYWVRFYTKISNE